VLRFVPPHDLTATCYERGIDLCDLSWFTGISEKDLASFSSGRLALSARHRLVIIVVLTHTMPEGYDLPREIDPDVKAQTLMALDFLRTEAEQEEAQEQSRKTRPKSLDID
jgi:hypothetical protein